MKIIGFAAHNGQPKLVLKGDSCLLNGHKPMFIPDWTDSLGVRPCMILRVSRLGKEIAPKFASRYYDAIAPGADFFSIDRWRDAMEQGNPWTEAFAFDYSLAIGEWIEDPETLQKIWEEGHWIVSPEEAIVQASKLMTIRQGDLIYIQDAQMPEAVKRGDVVSFEINGEDKLHCKIK